MFKTKSKKMREIVERELYLIESRLNIVSMESDYDYMDMVCQCLIAQKVILEQTLESFDKIES